MGEASAQTKSHKDRCVLLPLRDVGDGTRIGQTVTVIQINRWSQQRRPTPGCCTATQCSRGTYYSLLPNLGIYLSLELTNLDGASWRPADVNATFMPVGDHFHRLPVI